ncbi:hypothetical protein, partial [Motilimonas eburnea]|uniref:hypothetical protein n=1 Tax=Motilimonas eburnea TaxID=1737488 RepID=UPI001E5601C6
IALLAVAFNMSIHTDCMIRLLKNVDSVAFASPRQGCAFYASRFESQSLILRNFRFSFWLETSASDSLILRCALRSAVSVDAHYREIRFGCKAFGNN